MTLSTDSVGGGLYVLDRVTGEPIWPIVETPVMASEVPGEEAWPTQPAPSRPAPFAKQGFEATDVIDFTPAVKAAAAGDFESKENA